MLDGSDAVSDWPLLKRPAEHRRRRHLGLVPPRRWRGHGLLQHAGWSSSPMAPRLRPAAGAGAVERSGQRVMRHADAGYQLARDCAREQGLNLPMVR